MTTLSLPGGGRMPLLGFGTWALRGDSCVEAVGTVLEAGYRHLDTATIYDNEDEVGRALGGAGLPRDDVFVTTKCPPGEPPLDTLRRSLDLLGVEYVDLWLIHWSGGESSDARMWEDFVAAREQGLARDIGVSNLTHTQIDRLTDASGVTPAVDQIKWSPLLYRPAVAAGLASRGVVLEGYSGLKGGTLVDPTIVGVAERLGRTPAQVIVRWHLQHGFVVIPKSAQPDRIRANADVDFELSDDDLAALDSLGG